MLCQRHSNMLIHIYYINTFGFFQTHFLTQETILVIGKMKAMGLNF